MLDVKTALGTAHYDAFMRGLVRGRYHTLLGAGASAGGSSADGRALPVGSALAHELAKNFDLGDVSGASLRRIYAAAQRRGAPAGESLPEYLTRRFVATQPPAWMETFTKLPWAQIWTLNIDDCLERAYDRHGSTARQKPLSISWTERHRTPRSGLDEVLVVHLHGKSSRAQRDGELVFDISSYLNAVQANHRWHAIFGDQFPNEPFLILGASLDEELDLHGILEQGRLKNLEFPSVIVNRDVSLLQADEYRHFGLLPVAATAEDFFAAIEEDIGPYLEEVTSQESAELSDLSPAALTFLGQWQPLTESKPGRVDARHDIFVGHEPEWNDVLADKVVHRAVEDAIFKALDATLSPGASRIVLVRGGIFSGKTALLLSVGRKLARAGYRIFLHNGDQAPDQDAVIWWYQHYPKTVLLMDDAFDFTFDVTLIINEAEHAGVSPRFLLSERASRAKGTDRNLASVEVDGKRLSDTLTDGEIKGFIDKLGSSHRLGVMTGMTQRDKIKYFNGHGRQLFAALANLERGRGFEARVKDEYASISDVDLRRLMSISALLSWLGYGLPLPIAPRSTGMAIGDVEDSVERGALADFLHLRRGYVAPRHRMFGSLLVETCLSSAEKFAHSTSVAKAVAPHVSAAAIGIRSVYYLIARALMTHRVLGSLFDQDYSQVLDWYAGIEEEYGWNARYWEQRALAASLEGLYEPAYSWAKQAVHVRADAYTLNTVGTVLMRRALSEARESTWPTESFEAAEAALREARGLEAAESEYPYETFFAYTVRLVESVKKRDRALTEQLRNLWDQWYRECLSLDRPSQKRLLPVLEVVQPRWERATAVEG